MGHLEISDGEKQVVRADAERHDLNFFQEEVDEHAAEKGAGKQ